MNETVVFENGALKLVKLESTNQISVKWLGECDFRVPSNVLTPVLESVRHDAKGRRITLDFVKLEFMNSSSVSPLLDFVKAVGEEGGTVHLLYNESLAWQRTTAVTMRILTRMLKHLTVELMVA